MWWTRDLCVVFNHVNSNNDVPSLKVHSDNDVPSLKVHSELITVKIYGGGVNTWIKLLDKLMLILYFIFRVIINQTIPISLPNPILKDPFTSLRILEKSFSVKIEGAMYESSEKIDRKRKPPPESLGENECWTALGNLSRNIRGCYRSEICSRDRLCRNWKAHKKRQNGRGGAAI